MKKKTRVLLFDTETTGFPRTPVPTQPIDVQPYIIQMHAVLIDHDDAGYDILDVFSTHISGAPYVSKRITEINGINMQALDGKPHWSEAREGFFGLVDKAEVVCAHNFQFDARMVQVEELRLGNGRPFEDKKHRCSLLMSRTLNTTAPSHNLGRLYKHLFNEELKGQHTADADVGGLIRIYMHMVKNGAWKNNHQKA